MEKHDCLSSFHDMVVPVVLVLPKVLFIEAVTGEVDIVVDEGSRIINANEADVGFVL